jgi:hypothetical protein
MLGVSWDGLFYIDNRKIMKQLLFPSCLVGFVISIGIAAAPSLAEVQPPTWQQFMEVGGEMDIPTNYQLPEEFSNGYVYLNQGASTITAFILKPGLPDYPLADEGAVQINPSVARQFVQQGQALELNWNFSDSSAQYLDDTTVRFAEPGTACFRITCLTAPFLEQQEIVSILQSQGASTPPDPLLRQTSPVAPESLPSQENSTTLEPATEPATTLILQEQGILDDNSPLLPSDGSPYQEYRFQGETGQAIKITMESSEFHTYLMLVAPDGTVVRSEAIANQFNSEITATLVDSGTYRIIANAYEVSGRGRYTLTVANSY